MRYVIAGLHAAGRSACAWLRRLDPGAEIVGLDPEAAPAYARPLISHVLAGEIEPGLLDLAEPDPFAALGVTVVPERAVALDPDRREIATASGRTIVYDRLLLATGASPRRVDLGKGSAGDSPGDSPTELAGEVCYFRGREDLARLSDRIKPGGLAVVLGGGLVGFKLTVGLLARRMRVRLIVSSPRPLALNVDEYLGGIIGRDLAGLPGVELSINTSVTAVAPGRERRYRLVLSTGAEVEADLVAAGKGVVPAVDWLAGTGLDDREGIPVDAFLQTAAPEVYAAGDLARAFDVALQAPQVNAIWPLAVEQGRIAAWNMAGKAAPYPGGLAMNSIPMFGGHLVSVGAVNPRYTAGCESLALTPRRGSYLKLVFRENALVGAVGFNAAPRLGELAWAVRQGLKRERIPRTWLTNTVNAAPLAAATWGLAQNG
jgi:NAD(P)H-nitrite reductase large subunit